MVGQHLDGDRPIQARVPRPIDLAHAARAEGGVDLVGAEGGAGRERHRSGDGHPLEQLLVPVEDDVELCW